MKIGLVILQINVTDLEKARAYYVDTLGFEMLSHSTHVVEICLHGGPLCLLYKVDRRADNGYPDATGIIPVFLVQDIDAIHADWKAKGVEFVPCSWAKEESGIGDCPFGRFIGVRDPFGNAFEILQQRV
ncbi:MAG: VOC family protein [Candidatus Brocadiia bacterium]